MLLYMCSSDDGVLLTGKYQVCTYKYECFNIWFTYNTIHLVQDQPELPIQKTFQEKYEDIVQRDHFKFFKNIRIIKVPKRRRKTKKAKFNYNKK